MKPNQNAQNELKYIIYILLATLIIITFYPIIKTGLASGDDFQYKIVSLVKNFFSYGYEYAKLQGRIQYVITFPLILAPYSIGNLILLKSLNSILILINILQIGYISTLLFKKNINLIFLTICLAFLQVLINYNPLIAYPLFFTASFSMILLSITMLIKYYHQHYLYRLLGAFIFFLGFIFYEAYVMFILPIGAGVFLFELNERKSILPSLKQTFSKSLFYILAIVIYVTIYFYFHFKHPSTYEGTQLRIHDFSVIQFLKTLYNYSISGFPLHSFIHYFYDIRNSYLSPYEGKSFLEDLLINFQLIWIIKGLFIYIILHYSIFRINHISYKTLLYCFLLSFLTAMAINVPISLTEKYINLALWSYIPSYFSSFFLYAMILCILLTINNIYLKTRIILVKIFIILAIVIIAVSGMLTDYTNNHISKDLNKSKQRIESVEKLIETKKFKEIPKDAKIYCPKLWVNNSFVDLSITEQGNYKWHYFINAFTGNNYYTYRNIEEIDTSYSTYYVNYLQAGKSDDNLITLSKIKDYHFISRKGAILSDTVSLYYFSPNKKFSVYIESQDDARIIVNKNDTIHHEKWINIKTQSIFQEIELIGTDILVDEIKISNMVDPYNRFIEIKD